VLRDARPARKLVVDGRRAAVDECHGFGFVDGPVVFLQQLQWTNKTAVEIVAHRQVERIGTVSRQRAA
jgi:hypothetical protein